MTIDSNGKTDQPDTETPPVKRDDTPRMGALKFLPALQRKMEEAKEPIEWGLMFVDVWVNQRSTKNTMVDSRATYNFMTEIEASRLNLQWEKDVGRMKAVNSTT